MPPTEVSKYIVVSEFRLKDLTAEVNRKLDDGWVLVGGLATYDAIEGIFFQAMGR